ncbi:hypothetical protein GIY23_08710 [Allosaccharopolyspora coralli]|uniref:Uncharacterized protein n=1 Tax=Allosaccharopolyspora coralli TaxID=2665642 RepID=A0A5Q3QFI9_9PSEU|nr:hypothetical protein [Allosaccharopolyspora coralli]QGK69587.1 hypothetical protein GIY23_08710 [Allosaccharopolyspora coralli]
MASVRPLNDAGIVTCRPEIATFTDEEGVRFRTEMLGSAVTAGRLASRTSTRPRVPCAHGIDVLPSTVRRLSGER